MANEFALATERLSLRLSIASFFIALVITPTYLYLSGGSSTTFLNLREYVTFLLPILTAATVLVCYPHWKRDAFVRARWYFAPILALAFGFLTILGSYFALDFLSQAFRHLQLDLVSATFFVAFGTGITIYILTEEMNKLNLKKITLLLLGNTILGFLITASNHFDPRWWAGSLCALGMGVGTGVFWVYNITLVVDGLLLIVLGSFLTPYLVVVYREGHISPDNYALVKFIYIVEIVLLLVVGFLPYGHVHILSQFHLLAGNMVFLVFAVFMALAGFIFQGFRRFFYVVTYLLLSIGLILYFLYDYLHYFTITFYEINSIILISIWVVFLIKYIQIYEVEVSMIDPIILKY
jgi:hypothetical protein